MGAHRPSARSLRQRSRRAPLLMAAQAYVADCMREISTHPRFFCLHRAHLARVPCLPNALILLIFILLQGAAPRDELATIQHPPQHLLRPRYAPLRPGRITLLALLSTQLAPSAERCARVCVVCLSASARLRCITSRTIPPTRLKSSGTRVKLPPSRPLPRRGGAAALGAKQATPSGNAASTKRVWALWE